MAKTLPKELFFSDERRERSPELDFGVWWRNGSQYPTWRVSFITQTGELYAIDVQEHNVEVLGIVEGKDEADRRETVEHVLEGWAEECGKLNSLQWVRDRVHA